MRINNPDHDKINPFITNETIIPVPVIASFTSDGRIKPLYFSVDGIQFKIDNILSQDERVSRIHFRCDITLSDRVEQVDLYFYKNEYTWTLKRY